MKKTVRVKNHKTWKFLRFTVTWELLTTSTDILNTSYKVLTQTYAVKSFSN